MSKKTISSLTASREREVLVWIAARLPEAATPNMMTAIGAAGGGLACTGYILAHANTAWLWLSCFGLFLHWFGDSLDGTLARHRNIERKRYGMVLDQTVDILTVTLIFVGLALSPWVRFEVACLFIIGYLMLVALTHLRASAIGVYDIGFSGIGPTEGRLFLFGLTLIMMLVPPFEMTSWPVPMTSFDHAVLGMAAWTMGVYVRDTVKVLKKLAVEEPPLRPRERAPAAGERRPVRVTRELREQVVPAAAKARPPH